MYIALIEIIHNCIVFIRKAVLFYVRNKYYILSRDCLFSVLYSVVYIDYVVAILGLYILGVLC